MRYVRVRYTKRPEKVTRINNGETKGPEQDAKSEELVVMSLADVHADEFGYVYDDSIKLQ